MRTIDQVLQRLNKSRPMLEKMVDFKMNYKPQSLKKIEQFIESRRDTGVQLADPVIVLFSVYFGETIFRNIKGAEWVDSDLIENLHLKIPTPDGYTTAYPYFRIIEYLQTPNRYLYPYYCMLQDMSKGRLKTEDLNEKGINTIQSSRGYQVKAVKVPEELVQRHRDGEITQDEMIQLAKEEQSKYDS